MPSYGRFLKKKTRPLRMEVNAYQAAILLLIAFDLTLTIYQIAEDVSHPSAAESTWVLACTITIVSLLLLEVCDPLSELLGK